ncbi:MAG: GGDEF domain-containing protein [Tissierellales bacterium]|nr:GGDEF domain-containing protein [Tissierellales bacterium]
MSKLLNIESLMDTVDTLSSIYDAIRIINPVTKEIYYFKSDNSEKMLDDVKCYGYWEKNNVCQNCVSMKSYNSETTCVKIEQKSDAVFIVMAVPIWINNDKLVVEFIKDSSNSFTIKDLENDIKIDLLNSADELNNKASLDFLTGAYNRIYIQNTLPSDIYKSAINNSPISVIMADLDNFKNINDSFGHLVGDEVLKSFTNLVKIHIRENDWIARFGGDEFIIVLNNTNLENAYKVAERIRTNLENTKITYNDIQIQITASFGVYEIEEDEVKDDYHKAIEKADLELLKAKKKGKNIVKMS